MTKRRILITGATGYVGGRVSQVLEKRTDLELVVASRRATPMAWLPDIPVVTVDWESYSDLLKACEGVHTVLHLAAMNVIECAADPIGALEVNGTSSVRLLEAAKENRVSRFVHLSTAHIYGAPLAGRIDENTCPKPRHPYATSHRAGEDVVLTAHDEGKLTGLVVRLSNAFGVPAHPSVSRWTLLVNDLCMTAATERRLVLRSAGLQRRDFVTLHDVGRAISHLLDIPAEKAGDGIFNLGGACTLQVIELAELVQGRCQAVLGFRPEITRQQTSSADAMLDLDYRIDKLRATGFELNGSATAEIDATLKLCSTAFGGAAH